ncbi:MAG: hypothetical protein KC635_22715 [Myxococcales bacterium]|nr:hypothetical protein [Myxococcales bacterium]MCB9735586.1 hypothetical protein [Deltaproteobacteria bacterium]
MTTRVRGEQEKDPRRASAATHDETTAGRGGSARHDALRSAGGLAEQEAMLAPGGALDPVPMFHGAAPPGKEAVDGACPKGTLGRYADPAPYAWSVTFTRTMPSGGGRQSGRRETVTIEGHYEAVLLAEPNAHLHVSANTVGSLYNGTETRVTKRGGKVLEEESKPLDDTVGQNKVRFARALAVAQEEAVPGTKVESKAPSDATEAEARWCR